MDGWIGVLPPCLFAGLPACWLAGWPACLFAGWLAYLLPAPRSTREIGVTGSHTLGGIRIARLDFVPTDRTACGMFSSPGIPQTPSFVSSGIGHTDDQSDLGIQDLQHHVGELAPQTINLAILLAWNGEKKYLRYVRYDTSIEELKWAVVNSLQAETGQHWAMADIELVYDGHALKDSWAVAHCNLPFDALLHAVRKDAGDVDEMTEDKPYKVPAPGMEHGELMFDPTRYDNLGVEGIMEEFALENPSGYEAMRSEELAVFKHRPQQRFFLQLLANFDDYRFHNQSETADVINLARAYHDVCHEKRVHLENISEMGHSDADDVRNRDWLQAEEEIWMFLNRLCDLRMDDYELRLSGDAGLPVEEEHRVTRDDVAIARLRKKNRLYRYIDMVVEWFHAVATEKIDVFVGNIDEDEDGEPLWPESILLAKEGRKREQYIEELDPDAPLRQINKCLPESDEIRQEYLLKGVWTYLRAGKMSEAQELCENEGEAWRAASFFGGDEGENAHRSLWKYACWTLSDQCVQKDLNSRSSGYEEAIYATLAGNLTKLLSSPHCSGWKDHFWAYLWCMRERLRDKALLEKKEKNLKITHYLPGDANCKYEEEMIQQTEDVERFLGKDINVADEVFIQLQQSNNTQVKRETKQLTTIIQKQLIAGNFKGLVEDHILPSVDDDAHAHCRADLLRFGTHFVLWLDDVVTREEFKEHDGGRPDNRVVVERVSPEKRNLLIGKYISYLVKKRQTSYVALYVSHLPEEQVRHSYAEFLKFIVDAEERSMCTTLARRHFNNASDHRLLFETLDLAVKRISQSPQVERGMEDRILSVMATLKVDVETISPHVFSRAWGLQWLSVEVKHRERLAAVRAANSLCRSLLREQNQSDISISVAMDLILLGTHHTQQMNERNIAPRHDDMIPFIPSNTREFFEDIEDEEPEEDQAAVLSEYTVFLNYTEAQQEYLKWAGMLVLPAHLSEKPKRPANRRDLGPSENDKYQYQYEQHMRSFTADIKQMASQIVGMSRRVSELFKKLLYDVLHIQDGLDESQVNAIMSLQAMLIPSLANQYFSVNFDTGKWIQTHVLSLQSEAETFKMMAVERFKSSLFIASILADPKERYMDVFSSAEGKITMPILLDRIRLGAMSLYELEERFDI